jgi:membrane protease YdiL (CAAX protease family)
MIPSTAEFATGAGRVAIGGLSGARLATLLALTALPVILTTLTLRALSAIAGANVFVPLASPYRDFAVYALANWMTLALIVRVAGWRYLRAKGLRFPVTLGRLAGAVLGFTSGLAVYMGVSWWLQRMGLPPVRGMQFLEPSITESAVMFFSVVLTAAFCEEIFFRVLWVGALRRLAPAWVVGLVSIVAFAAIHYPYFGTGGVIFISVWALLPVTLFIYFDDLTASFAMHVMNNVFAYLVVPLLFAGTN